VLPPFSASLLGVASSFRLPVPLGGEPLDEGDHVDARAGQDGGLVRSHGSTFVAELDADRDPWVEIPVGGPELGPAVGVWRA
jgi:hypothetical protein